MAPAMLGVPDGSDLVGPLRDLLYGVDRAEDVRTEGHGDDLRPLREEIVILLHPQRPLVGHIHVLQDGPFVILHEMPRNVVRMVLHDRADDLVPRLELPLQAVSVGHDVEGLCRGFREHDFVRRLGSDEGRDLFARPFVLAGGLLSQFINGPMDVRVVSRVEIRRRVDDLLWLLRGRGAVEVDEPAVMDLPL